MINATEIRIGSLFDTPEGIQKANGFNREDGKAIVHFANHSHHDSELCHAIPLTPEWLEWLGFEKQSESYYVSNVHPDLHIHGSDIFDLYKAGCGKIASTKYVHQLQNLYFALTGEELTIKEPIIP
jgi:hypothetical protein